MPGLVARLVALAASALDALGLDGRRVRWWWARRQATGAEARAQRAVALRSTTAAHKMCPACRALVPRSAGRCSECGGSLAGVSIPGPGRLLTNLFPGITAASSLILLVNGLLFLLVLMTPDAAGGRGSSRLLSAFGSVLLMRYGAGSAELVWLDGEWFRMFTSLFLHGGLLHFGFNSYALLQLGPLAEEGYGAERFWVIYLFSGLMGNVAAQLLGLTPVVVGASGSIVGVVGLLLAYGMRRGGVFGGTVKSVMLQYAMYTLVLSLLPGVSFLSHAGGFVGGFLAGWIVPAGPLRTRAAAVLWQILALAGVIAVLASFYQVALHGSDFLRHVE